VKITYDMVTGSISCPALTPEQTAQLQSRLSASLLRDEPVQTVTAQIRAALEAAARPPEPAPPRRRRGLLALRGIGRRAVWQSHWRVAPRRERSRLIRAWRLLRTRSPRTFTDKVRYKMLRDRRQLLVTFADKAAVRDHVAARLGADCLPRLVALVADPAGLRDVQLPGAYVVKPTHGSGAVVVVGPDAPADARLPAPGDGWGYSYVRPEMVDRERLVELASEWSEQLYGQGPNKEWAYGHIPRQTIVEELLVGSDGGIPQDYKIFVFHQQARFVQVDAGRFGHRTQDFYTTNWQHLPLSGGPPWAASPQPRPERLDEMLAMAETLGAGTDFVRVDLYALPDRIVFGELTSYPGAGDNPFYPESFNEEFGRTWTVPRRYR